MHCFTFPPRMHMFRKSSHPYQCLLFSGFLLFYVLIIAVLMDVEGYLIVSVCIFLVISDIEHLLPCILANTVSSLKKCLLKFFAHLWSNYFLLLSCWSLCFLIAWILIPYQIYNLQIFFPIVWVAFSLLLICPLIKR